jgi:starch synthase
MIHNLYYQGTFDHKFVSEMDYDDGQSPIPSFFSPRLLKINGMRRGIMHADIISTVSPTYAKEIMTPDYGELLDGLLRERRSRLYGILNGIDYAVWDAKKDSLIEHQFSKTTLDIRGQNKAVLQNRFGLEVKEDAFLVAIVSRLTGQKGLDLVMDILPSLLREINMQLVVLGEGEDKYMHFFQGLHTELPTRVGIDLKFDQSLPHAIFAGADAALIPSQFEPSGLTQMEAMHYGAVPIVRKTGGLADTVDDYSPLNKKSTGFVFEKYEASSLLIAIVRAYENFQNKKIWRKLKENGMTKDFSWEHSAQKYQKTIEKAVKKEVKRDSEGK